MMLAGDEFFPHMVDRHPVGFRQIGNAVPFLGVQAFDFLLGHPGQKEHLAVRKLHHPRLPLGGTLEIQSRLVQQSGTACQPLGAVVIAGNGQYLHPQLPAEPVHGVIIQPDGRCRRYGAVVYVSRQQHHIHSFLPDNAANGIDEIFLVVPEVPLPACGTQVPVGSMQKNHIFSSFLLYLFHYCNGCRRGSQCSLRSSSPSRQKSKKCLTNWSSVV